MARWGFTWNTRPAVDSLPVSVRLEPMDINIDAPMRPELVCSVCDRAVSEVDGRGRCTGCEASDLEPLVCACGHFATGHELVDGDVTACPDCGCSRLRAA